MDKTIAVITGDGIGPEIVGEAIGVLDAVAAKYGHVFTYREAPMLEDIHDRDNAQRLRRLVRENLTPREAEIIRLRYGLGGTVPLTQREVAVSFGISRSYVSRIEKRALSKLQTALGE